MTLVSIGAVRDAQGLGDEAIKSHEASLEIRRRIHEEDPENTVGQYDVANSWAHIGCARETNCMMDGAAEAFQNAITILDNLCEHDPQEPNWPRYLAKVWNRMGCVLEEQDKIDEAVEAHNKELALIASVCEQNPYDADMQYELYTAQYRLASVNEANGDLEEALEAFKEAARTLRHLIVHHPEKAAWCREQAWTCVYAGEILEGQDRFLEAQVYQREAHRLFAQLQERGVELNEEDLNELGDLNAKFGPGGSLSA
jgi:tetratricopeptide (TPR) repeat protein